MKDYSSLFKAYDIRGIRDELFDDYFAYSMGIVMSDISKAGKIFISGDTRKGNKNSIEYFVAGLVDGGNKNFYVMNDGKNGPQSYLCSTTFSYKLGTDDFDFGVIFTASHNPAAYQGMKIFDKDGNILETSILREKFLALKIENIHKLELEKIYDSQNISDQKIIEKKLSDIKNWFDAELKDIKKPMKIAVDFSGGACTKYEYEFLKNLNNQNIGFEFLNFLPDENFSAHETDTLEEKNYQQLQNLVKEKKLDAGLMFDGDGDRIGFVDERGEIIAGDILVSIFAENILKTFSGAKILYDLRCSKTTAETIEKNGGVAIKTRVGHKFIKSDMKKLGAHFAGEVSGHYYFLTDQFGGYEFALYYISLFLQGLQNFKTTSDLTQKYKVYKKSPEINFVVRDTKKVFEKIENLYSNYEIENLDGMSVYTDNYWFNVRSSNTEPKMRLNLEVYDEKDYENILENLKSIFNE